MIDAMAKSDDGSETPCLVLNLLRLCHRYILGELNSVGARFDDLISNGLNLAVVLPFDREMVL